MWINDWIPTLEKWKRGYELRVGDIIFDGKGNPAPINELVSGEEIIKRINISDKTYIDCHDNELIKIGRRFSYLRYRDKYSHIDLADYDNFTINDVGGYPKFFIPNGVISIYPNQFLDIEPYIMGCLIGHAQKRWKDNDLLLTIDIDGSIPENYRTAPLRDRKDLLAGMLDTNGIFNLDRHTNSFGTDNPILAIHIHELICSLGGTCVRSEERGAGKKYFLYFCLTFNPFKQKLREYDKWYYDKQKDYKSLDSIVELEKLETIIPIVRGGEYLQGRWYISKKYEKN